MRVPAWITIAIAAIVIVFGLYRIRMALQKPSADPAKKSVMGGGLYRMSPRAHLIIGVLYLALGGCLIATSFGWNPFGRNIGPGTEVPSKDAAPAKPGSIPVDTIKH